LNVSVLLQPDGPHGVDQLAAFAALLFSTTLLRPQWWLQAGCLAILYGGVIEVIQSFDRSARVLTSQPNRLALQSALLGLSARRILLK